ncbi:MAG: hypothetical protein QM726_05780 [Chitinophagaceae bacterium]
MIRSVAGSIFSIITLLSICSCGKNPTTPPTPTTTNKCLLISETVNGGPGYGASWVYQYDADGHLLKGTNPPVNGQTPDGLMAINNNAIGISFSAATYGSGTGKMIWSYFYAGDLKGGSPTSGYQDFTNADGKSYPRWDQYIFGYDAKKRITEVAINAGTINISYDDNDNVVKMTFITNNGPRVISPIVTIEGYDNKPNPHVADPNIWKFTQQMFSWSYFTEYRVISALSKNNPGKITTDYPEDATSKTVDDIIYQYNDKNMPTVATVQRTFRGAKSSYQSNFYGYSCQ